jgi:uncharacterized lipoprotein YmbA
LLAVVCSGCASKEPLPSFYVLGSPAAVAPASIRATDPRIFIRRVTLPGYLQPTTIASRRADAQIEYSATALWAEGLRGGFGRALADALAQRPGIGAVSLPPISLLPTRDYDLDVEVERFEGNDAGEVILEASWQLCRPESAAPVVSRRSHFGQAGWTYGDAASQARLLGVNVQEFAAQIAKAVRR